MKKHILVLLLVFFTISNSFASGLYIRLNSSNGDFAQIGEDLPSTPTPNHPDCAALAWTNNGADVIGRHLLKFNSNLMPVGAILVSAKLSLFANNNPFNSPHSTQSGSNETYIRRVVGAWNSTTVCYNNQPGFSTTNEVIIGPTTMTTQNFLQIDITDLYKDILASGQNNGMILMLQTEMKYRSMNFASGANQDTSLQPLLEIEYTSCTDLIIDDNSGSGDGVISDVQPGQNYASVGEFVAYAANIGGVQFIGRSLLQLDLSGIPSGSTIYGAALSLYANSSVLPSFPATTLLGNNDCLLLRTNQNWNVNSVNFSNQPAVTLQNAVLIPHPVLSGQDYLNLDISGLVSDMYANPSVTSGLVMQLVNESGNKSLNFCSSNHADSLKWPKVVVCYQTANGLIKEDEIALNIYSYPNPADDEIRFKSNEVVDQYEVLDVRGQSLFKSQVPWSLSELKFSVLDFSPGLYLFKAKGRTGNITSKFIVK